MLTSRHEFKAPRPVVNSHHRSAANIVRTPPQLRSSTAVAVALPSPSHSNTAANAITPRSPPSRPHRRLGAASRHLFLFHPSLCGGRVWERNIGS